MTQRLEELAAEVASALRPIADFPRPGIVFQDITPLLAVPRLYLRVTDALADTARSDGITHVAAIESRGFLFGAPVAQRLGAALVPIRKPGKLPSAARRVDYALEYGVDALEMHTDACGAGARVLVVDDVLATGGTCRAAIELLTTGGATVVACAFLLELIALGGTARLAPVPTRAVLKL